MRNLFLLFFLFIFATNPAYSQDTIHIPADYSTIQAGIDTASDGDLVLVSDGTYIENIDFNGKGITVASYFLIDDDTSHISNTVIDGSQPVNPAYGSVVLFQNGEDSASILCGFTITGGTGRPFSGYNKTGGGIFIYNSAPIIKNNIIEFNEVSDDGHVAGSAINIYPSVNTLLIENNIIRNNLAQSTGTNTAINGTIMIWARAIGKVIIRNNIISDNTLNPAPDNHYCNGGAISAFGGDSPNYICIIENNIMVRNVIIPQGQAPLGGAILMEAINASVRNNIIAYNSAARSGAIHYWNPYGNAVHPVLENNTIYGNTATIYGGAISTHHYYEVINCIIWGNSYPQYSPQRVPVITYSDLEESYSNGSNNISLEPGFLDTTFFFLSDTSVCIDSGNPDPMYNDVEDPLNPGYPLWPAQGTLLNDMGHCGVPKSSWQLPVSVESDEESLLPSGFTLFQNYPNPFNPTTTIKYQILELSFVTLKVYDVLGNEVTTLINGENAAGYYEVKFNASALASGIYFYQLRAGDFVETKKMILLK